MTHEEVKDLVESFGLPYAYRVFKDEEYETLRAPFIIFYYPTTDNFHADGIVYQKIERLVIELYTADKEFELEESIETKLTEAGLIFSKEEELQSDEKAIGIQYLMEVDING